VGNANIDDVLKSWEGLGYYSRARNFHFACKKLVDENKGAFPRDPEEFLKCKGVGPYI